MRSAYRGEFPAEVLPLGQEGGAWGGPCPSSSGSPQFPSPLGAQFPTSSAHDGQEQPQPPETGEVLVDRCTQGETEARRSRG